ncbi:MAG: PAS domain S-box protein [Aminivibrio sp.]|nr:PAS domain S-box protein [Synergistaceae bacterium]
MSTDKTCKDGSNSLSGDFFPEGVDPGLRYFFKRSALPMFISDPATLRILAANPAAWSFYGYRPEEFLSMTVLDIAERSREEIMPAMELVKSDRQKVFSSVHKLADGSLRYVELNVVPLDDDNSIFLTSVQDVTEQREAEDELRRSEENFRTLAESTRDVIWTMDLNGGFTYVSPSVMELRGYTPEEVMKQTPGEALTEGSRIHLTEGMKKINENIAAGRPMFSHHNRYELEQPCKDGSTVWTEATFSGIYDPEGNPAGIIGVTRDITEQKKTRDALDAAMRELEQKSALRKEEALELEKAARARSAFLVDIGRDLITTLNGIAGMAALSEGSPGSGGFKPVAEAVRKNGESLIELVSNLLDLSDLGKGRLKLTPSLFNLDELVDEICRDYGSGEKKIRLLRVIDSDAPRTLSGDPARLRQILDILLSNAFAFTDEGEVEVQISAGEANPSETTLTFSVRDTGPGIPPDALPSLFEGMDSLEEFIAGCRRRSGLGLAVARGLVKLMNGWISVKSPAGTDPKRPGSIFTFAVRLGLPAGGRKAPPTLTGRPAPEVFNAEALLESCGGDKEAARRAAADFISLSLTAASRLSSALYRQDYRDAARQARLLKIQSGRLKAPLLRSASFRMEKAGKAVDKETCAPLMESLLNELAQLMEALARPAKETV